MATAFFAGAFTSHQLEPHRFLKRGQLPGSCTPSSPIAQKTRDNSGTSPSNLLLRLRAKRQQRPETPALIRRIHTSSSHHAPHRCSDSAEEWIKPGSNDPLRRRTAPPATPVAASSPRIHSGIATPRGCIPRTRQSPTSPKQWGTPSRFT